MPDDQEPDQNARAFEELLAPILKPAFGTAFRLTGNREEAEDLVQEAVFQAFRAFGTFQPGSNFKAWYFCILVNLFRKKHRQRKREPETLCLEDAPNLYLYRQAARLGCLKQTENPLLLVLQRLGEEQIQQAIAALPDCYQMISILYFMEEMSYQEIADVVGCPIGTVRSRLHRGRDLLQKALWQLAGEHGITGLIQTG